MLTSKPDEIATPASNYEKYKDMFTQKKKDQLNMETFYQLLIAEMSNQDPLEPTSNTEFISQMASFAALQSQQDNFDMQKKEYANSLVGQTVSVSEGGAKKELITGVVDHVVFGDEIKVSIDGKSYSLSAIKQVHGFENLMQSGDDYANVESSLQNYGAFAAGILGKTITVQATKPDGELVLDSGTAQSLEIQNGQVRVILNGVAYNVTDVVSVTDAVKVRDENSDDEEDELPAQAAASTQQPSQPAADKTGIEDDKDDPLMIERTDENDIADLIDEEEKQQAAAQTTTQETTPAQQTTDQAASQGTVPAEPTPGWTAPQENASAQQTANEAAELYSLFGG